MLHCRCSSERAASIIVDNLRVNVFSGEINRQPRPFRCASDPLPNPLMNALPRRFASCRHIY